MARSPNASSDPRLNLTVAAVTLLVCLGLVATGDRTGWSQGFGFDGRTYGDLAEHFPGAVFGDEGVATPGYGAFHGPKPHGIDGYYVRRILPSAVVYFTLSGLSIDRTPHNVVIAFAVWDAVAVSLVALLWCMTADLLGITRPGKLLGLIGLLVNFAVLKSFFYWPVATDAFAFAFGAAAVYLWLANRRVALAAVTFLGAFAWPTQLPFGALLLLFPPRRLPLRSAPGGRGAAAAIRAGVAGMISLALLGYLVYLRIDDYHPQSGITPGGAFAVAAVAAALLVFAALYWLLPEIDGRGLREIGRSMLGYPTLLVAALVAAVLLTQSAITERPSVIDQGELIRSSFFYSALDPGLFLVAAIGFFGPLLLLVALRWPGVCRRLHAFGPGATLAMALVILTALATEPRKLVLIYPFVVLFAVLELGDLTGRRWFLGGFATASILLSRVWLPIGKFDGSSLHAFPAQRYFLSSGIWTTTGMYLAQLGAVLLLTALFLGLRRSPSAPTAPAVGGMPGG